ncbi:MAG: thiamine pyrophosphate-dependent enzyme, partial [Pseudomonadota bacterium]
LGYACMSGEVAAVTITQGPALSNAITPLIDGVKGMVPLVLLCGDTSLKDPDHPQAVAQEALIQATGAGYLRVRSQASAALDVETAFRRARIERRPIVLAMPTEMMWEPSARANVRAEAPPARLAPVDEDALYDAVGLLAAARRPLVLGGRGAVAARDALVRLAHRLGAPLATSLKAKGLFHGEAYDIGVFGTLSTPAASEVIAQSDCVIAFGAGLNRFTTARGDYLAGKRLIQVDDDAMQLARRARPDAAIHGDPGAVADSLIKWLDEAEIPSSQATDTIDAQALRAPLPLPPLRNAPGTVDVSRALHAIDEALGPDKVFVSDGGRFLNEAWTRITVTDPRNMLLSVNVGAIGLGTGYAIGASVARPGQTTLLVTGDGGFMMGGLAEFTSAVREGLDLVVVVCNDNCYGAEYVQFTDRQMDPGLSLFHWPSLAEAAVALGGDGLRVTSEAELDAISAKLTARKGPLLIELMLDAAHVPRLHL